MHRRSDLAPRDGQVTPPASRSGFERLNGVRVRDRISLLKAVPATVVGEPSRPRAVLCRILPAPGRTVLVILILPSERTGLLFFLQCRAIAEQHGQNLRVESDMPRTTSR